MPRFKSTVNIFTDYREHFNDEWMNSSDLIVPVVEKWSYDKEMSIDDVDLWEVIYEASAGKAVYVAYVPYAEFYLICLGHQPDGRTPRWETHYGAGAELTVRKRMKELNYPINVRPLWVENEDLWLYQR